MLTPLATQSTTSDPFVDPLAPDAMAPLASRAVVATVAETRTSRRLTRNLLIVANTLVWIVIVIIVRLSFF